MRQRVDNLHSGADHLSKRLHALETRLRCLEDGAGLDAPLLDPDEMMPLDRSQRIELAGWEFENAIFNEVLAKYPKDVCSARDHHVQLLRADKWFSRAIVALILLTFFEVPAWCHENTGHDNGMWTFRNGTDWCVIDPEAPEKDPNLSGVWYLPPGYALLAEVAIELIVLRKFYLSYTLQRDHFEPRDIQYHYSLNTRLGFMFALGSVLDTAAFTMFRQKFRLTFLFRTGLISLLPSVQHIFFNIFNKRVMWEFGSIMVFFVGTIVFFAWIAVTIFSGDQFNEISYMEGEEAIKVNKDMDTFTAAIYTMFVGGVTGDFIDCYLPTFNTYHVSGLLWMLYLLLTQVLFKNLVMDTLISAYLKGAGKETKMTADVQARAIEHAYRLLTSGSKESLTKDVWLEFVQILGKSPRWYPIPDKAADLMFESADGINKENFCELCMIVQNQYWVTKRRSALNLPDSHFLVKIVREPEETPTFDKIMTQVLLLNLVWVVVESYYDMNCPAWMGCTVAGDEPTWMNWVDTAFSLAYVVEVGIKLAVQSWGEYWSSGPNRFDFITTWLLLATVVVQEMPDVLPGIDLNHYANILRLLRLIRILKQLKQYPRVQFMVFTITRICTAAGEILSLMGTFFFFFASLSVNLFGGVLYEGNEALDESEYKEKGMWLLNFNDMFSASAMWFVQILCEYVPPFADAIAKAAPHGHISWVIFLIYYLSTAAIMYELLLAFTVEVFMQVKEDYVPEEEEDEEEEEEPCCFPKKSEKEKEKEEEEEKEEKEENEERKRSKDRNESREEQEKEEEEKEEKAASMAPSKFYERLQDKVIERDMMLHVKIKYSGEFQEELAEAYEKVCEKEEEMKNAEGYQAEEEFPPQVNKAAWQLENILYNQEPFTEEKVLMYPEDVNTAWEAHLKVCEATKMYYKAILALVFLTLVEVPAWCHKQNGKSEMWSWAAGTEWCPTPDPTNDKYNLNLSGIWYLPPGYALVVEMVIELIILRKFISEYNFERDFFKAVGVEYYNKWNIRFGCFFAVGSMVDTLIFAILRLSPRFTFIFRTGLLCLLPGVQRLTVRIFNRKMMGEFVSVAIFFVGTVLFFAWIGLSIFRDLDVCKYPAVNIHNETISEEERVCANHGFSNLADAVYTMFIAGITEGFVETFIPSVTHYRLAGPLWFIFLLLCQVLFLNLVIDAFVCAYLEGSEKLIGQMAKQQAKGLMQAFNMLSGGGEEVSKETFQDFAVVLRGSVRMKSIGKTEDEVRSTAAIMYEELGKVDAENFIDVCTLVQQKVWTAPRDSFLKDTAPGLWDNCFFKWLRGIVWESRSSSSSDTAAFDEFMDWVLLLNLVLVVQESVYGLYHWDSPAWMDSLDEIFTVVYIVEVLVKLSVKSFKEYWSIGPNQFDFFTTCLLSFTTILQNLPGRSLQADLSHYANILRLLRLLRVVKKLKQYKEVQFMANTVVRMVDAASEIMQMLGVLCFLFTTFSVNFFGGILYEGHEMLEDTDYAKKHWFVFNFNDSIMGFVTWFTQLLCEYSPEWAEALYLTSSWGRIAWYIYPAFYLVGVAILFEIFKAFTIETFLALKEEADKENGEDEEEDSDDEEEMEKLGKEMEKTQEDIIEGIARDLLKQDIAESLQYRQEKKKSFWKEIKMAYNECLEDIENKNMEQEKNQAAFLIRTDV